MRYAILASSTTNAESLQTNSTSPVYFHRRHQAPHRAAAVTRSLRRNPTGPNIFSLKTSLRSVAARENLVPTQVLTTYVVGKIKKKEMGILLSLYRVGRERKGEK